jgi:hypothetical protein
MGVFAHPARIISRSLLREFHGYEWRMHAAGVKGLAHLRIAKLRITALSE